jgi:CheY-like chemotaxis protein
MKLDSMLACYFPTTVVFIDDNAKSLENVRLGLDPKKAIYKFFSSSIEAFNFLKEYKSDSFTHRCLLQKEDEDFDQRSINVDISKIHQEIYSIARFTQISLLVVDYAMPGLTGEQLIQQLKDKNFKIILLTGEANHSHAVRLFNDGMIHHFLRKDDADIVKLSNEAILQLQYNYLKDLSDVVINSITQKASTFDMAPSCLSDPVFIQFFYDFVEKKKFTEYYLLDEFGSFLFLDENGKTSWLIVKDEEAMEATEYEMNLESVRIDSGLRQAIHKREVLRHAFNNTEYPTPENIGASANLFYPATKLSGKANYYYSYIEKPLMKPKIDTTKIISYNQYLSSYLKK